MEEIILISFFGAISGTFLTFMDRVDEHELITGKLKTPFAYIFAILAAISFIYSIHYFNFLYPFLFGLCIEWIIKNKLEYPSHVFFLFIITLYFGYKIDLFFQYYIYILIYLILKFFISSFLKNKVNKNSKFYKYFYANYLSKFLSDIFLALILSKVILIFFGLTSGYFPLLIKKYFPGKKL